MATQADHIQATIAQMQQAVAEQRRVLAEMEETLAALQRTPGYLKSGTVGTHLTPTPTVEKVVGTGTRVLANRNVTAFVRDYLAEYHKYDEKININEIVDYLVRRGVKGKPRSLYSAVHVILKKEVRSSRGGSGGSGLHYKTGVGFFKSREKVDDLTHREPELI